MLRGYNCHLYKIFPLVCHFQLAAEGRNLLCIIIDLQNIMLITLAGNPLAFCHSTRFKKCMKFDKYWSHCLNETKINFFRARPMSSLLSCNSALNNLCIWKIVVKYLYHKCFARFFWRVGLSPRNKITWNSCQIWRRQVSLLMLPVLNVFFCWTIKFNVPPEFLSK